MPDAKFGNEYVDLPSAEGVSRYHTKIDAAPDSIDAKN